MVIFCTNSFTELFRTDVAKILLKIEINVLQIEGLDFNTQKLYSKVTSKILKK